ncbi:MAG: ABC transporter ATP-binding protein/permease [Clostridia bacterium]|nr:ABC transporter ATP-binding protein/permease [Clostridia bacterium]
MIKIEKVNKYFNRRRRNEIHIINNTSLELENKGLVAILGQSGSGKTTLLNAIGGLDKVSNGKIYINGKKITRRTTNTVDKIRNLNIGYIFQDYKLIENMSVFDNVAIALRMIGIKNKKEIQKRVNYVLEAVNMYRYRNRPAQMLSGGEKQRVAIARAIVKNPSIVIADEPTGNLDSKNSLEIMNIIKAISKEKLVILVTHEVDLAKFYATRVVELQDGKIVNDYSNESKESLEYRLDNKIYLKDFKDINNLKNKKINIDVYSDDENAEIDVKLVLKNGNIFIQAENKKIEVVDDNSGVEFINDHYKKIDKSIYEKYKYNLDEIIDNKYKPRYSSIYGIVKSIRNGFNRILNYTVLKKVLLLGFFASAMFVVYSVSNIAGATDIRESDYIKIDRNYLQVDMAKVNVDDYLKYENLENIDYMIPGNSNVSFKIKMDNYYQLSTYSFELSGSLVDLDKINENDIFKGRMPQNEYEIIIDKKVADNMLNEEFSMIKGMGIKNEDELLNRVVTIDGMKEFTIVGFVDDLSASIYVKKSLFMNILNNMTQSDAGMGIYFSNDEENSEATVKDYNLFLDDITITKGRLPENDYEVIVNKSNEEEMKLNKPIKAEVNGKQLTVVGYYDSKTNKQEYLVNNNTVKYNVISNNNGFTIYPKDKAMAMDQFQNEYHLNIIDRYEKDKNEYINEKHDEIRSAVIFAGVILAISLVEIYLMIRSSFLSRIKEIGVLRAIGVKKKDIYRMFLGEIISITTLASMPGIALMTYILSQVSKIPFVNRMFIINFNTVGIAILIVYVFNIIVGLLPLFRVIRKTPARILARHDVE